MNPASAPATAAADAQFEGLFAGWSSVRHWQATWEPHDVHLYNSAIQLGWAAARAAAAETSEAWAVVEPVGGWIEDDVLVLVAMPLCDLDDDWRLLYTVEPDGTVKPHGDA